MFGLLCGLLGGFWLDREQTQLADRVIRFHVIANSDSPEDQALKLQVRDRVLAETETFYPERATLEEARAALEAHLEELAAAGQAAVTEAGRSEPVTARLERCWFPTKEGEYPARGVVRGGGGGERGGGGPSPPLCLEAASETVDEAAAAGYFSPGQAALITEEDRGYVLKFRAMELLGEWKGLLCR